MQLVTNNVKFYRVNNVMIGISLNIYQLAVSCNINRQLKEFGPILPPPRHPSGELNILLYVMIPQIGINFEFLLVMIPMTDEIL
jgi:hypothetical protein